MDLKRACHLILVCVFSPSTVPGAPDLWSNGKIQGKRQKLLSMWLQRSLAEVALMIVDLSVCWKTGDFKVLT